MQLFVRLISGKVLSLNVECSDTIDTIKKKVAEAQGIEPGKQQLLFSGTILEDQEKISKYGIIAQSTLFLVIITDTQSEIIQAMEVKIACGEKEMSLKVTKTNTIGNIKDMIVKNMGGDIATMILMFKGQKLSDHKKLEEINIKDKDVIQLVTTLHGGL